MNSSGFTLVEVLVALLVLAVGLTAVAGLQLSGLQLGRQAERTHRLLETAENELRHRLLGLGSGATCSAWHGEGPDCRVQERSCLPSASELHCGTPGGRLTEVTVSVSWPGGTPLELTGYRLAGATP